MNSLKKFTNNNIFAIIAFLIPVLVVFRVIFSQSSLSLGDSPYFAKDAIPWFFTEPMAWTTRGISFGGINQFLWVWPLTFVISLSQKLLSLDSWTVIRIFFIIPSLFLSSVGSFSLSKQLKSPRLVSFFVSFLAIFNSYYLLIFDGGQVGILLAYGIFPCTLYFLIKYYSEEKGRINYLLALTSLIILTIADPRVSLICFGTSIVFALRNLKKIVVLLVPWALLNLYWLYPLFNFSSRFSVQATDSGFTSLLTGFFLYSPHWYQNIYGNITYPSVFFFFIPPLIVISFFASFKFKRPLLMLFLFLVFLVKGTTEPLGGIYSLLLRLPFGFAFRDSTKFMIPLVFITGILAGNGILYLKNKLKISIIPLIFYVLIILTVTPAILGKMNFVLSGHESLPNVGSINALIKNNPVEDRTVWFPERDPRSLESNLHEVIDAKDLVSLRPFASLNVGTEDLFNFLHNDQTDWWIDMLGIKHFVLSGDPRNPKPTDANKKDWHDLNTLVSSLNYLQVEPSNNIVYTNKNYLPRLYGVEKLFVVVGSDNIYSKLGQKYKDFKPYNYGFVFVDDGKWDPQTLTSYATTSAVILKNNESEKDLAMSMLQKTFYGEAQVESSQFANFSSDQYLKYKYELLIRNVHFEDFDFMKGLAFSSQTNENLVFKYKAPKDDDYVVSVRTMTNRDTNGMALYIDNKQVSKLNSNDHLVWDAINYTLSKGDHIIKLVNQGGLQVFNVLSVVSKSEYAKAFANATDYMQNYKTYDVNAIPLQLLKDTWREIDYKSTGAGKITLNSDDKSNWIVWTNNYNEQWQLGKDQIVYSSIPFYSSVNGLYKRPEWTELTLNFGGQDTVRWGDYYSLIVLLLLVIIFLTRWQSKKHD